MNATNPSLSPPNSADPSASEANGGIARAKQRLKSSATEAVHQVKDAASSAAQRVKEEASRLAADRKTAAADRIGGYSSAIHDSAKSLEENDPNIAWFTHRAAERLQGVADYVRRQDFNSLRRDVGDVAKRHPALFFGGLFVAGFVIGNFVKASAGGDAQATDPADADDDTDTTKEDTESAGASSETSFADTNPGSTVDSIPENRFDS